MKNYQNYNLVWTKCEHTLSCRDIRVLKFFILCQNFQFLNAEHVFHWLFNISHFNFVWSFPTSQMRAWSYLGLDFVDLQGYLYTKKSIAWKWKKIFYIVFVHDKVCTCTKLKKKLVISWNIAA